MSVDEELAARYNIPQGVRDWKKEIESEIDSLAIVFEGKKYVKLQTAKNFMRQTFEKGFKFARRNRNALGNYLLSQMERRFIIKEK